MSDDDSPYTGGAEADALVRSIDDVRARAFVQLGITTVLTRRGMPPEREPAAAFDLAFFAEVLHAMYASPGSLQRIVDGNIEDAAWWPDDR